MAEVFLSSARADADIATPLAQALEARNCDTWFDLKIVPAAPWRPEIETQIQSAQAFLFLISPNSVRSAECLRELNLATTLKKRIIPVALRAIVQGETPAQIAALQCKRPTNPGVSR